VYATGLGPMSEGDSRAREREVADAARWSGQATSSRAGDPDTRPPAESISGSEDPGRQRSLLSPDQSWWWDGRRWVSATTSDGLWAWNGRRWRTTLDLEGKRPEEIAEILATVADDRYAEAGEILVARAAEWEPEGQLRELVMLAEGVRTRLQQMKQDLTATPDHRRLGRRAARQPPDPRALEEEQAALKARQMGLLVPIGRLAPQPSVKEADDIRAGAELLDQRTQSLRAALSGVEEAEAMQARATRTAREELLAAETTRLEAIRRARRGVEEAKFAHASAIKKARAAFRSATRVSAGELKAGLGSLRIRSTLLETSRGVLPAASLTTDMGSAVELWQRHRELMADLALLELPETAAFVTSLLGGTDTQFVLFISAVGVILWSCPEGQAAAAKRFLGTVRVEAERAATTRNERDSLQQEAERQIEAAMGDRSSIDAAEAELARVQVHHDLLESIEQARRRVARLEKGLPELREAQQRLAQVVSELLTAPESIGPVPGGPA
jgi:hypothetical protein